MSASSEIAPRIDELVHVRELHTQPEIKDLFPSEGSVEWQVRQHRRDYIAGGALFEIAGRLLADPSAFRRVALEIGAKTLATRHGVEPKDPTSSAL